SKERMTGTDIKGLGVSTNWADAVRSFERGLDLFLRWRAGVLEAPDAAAQSDSRFALAYCAKAHIASRMGGPTWPPPPPARPPGSATMHATTGERLHVRAVDALQRGDHPATYDSSGA